MGKPCKCRAFFVGWRVFGSILGSDVENEYLDRDPAMTLRTPKKREALPDILERAEMRRLLNTAGRADV
jgi:site-specific recombinase XerC